MARDVMFKVVHNILPTKERLYRLRMLGTHSPNCAACTVFILAQGPLRLNSKGRKADLAVEAGGGMETLVYLLMECRRVEQFWGWMRSVILGLLPQGHTGLSNLEMLHLVFPEESSLVT